MNTNRALSLTAIGLSMIALGTMLWDHTPRSAKSTGVAPDAGTVAALERELASLQSAHDQLRRAHQQLEARVADQAPSGQAPPAGDATGLESRLAALELKQTELAQFTRDIDKYGVVDAMENELLEAYSTLLDTSQTAWARAKRSEQLKRYGHFDERAVQSMMELFANAEDRNDKAAALTALKGVVDTRFRDQILAELNAEVRDGNPSARFRYHAIEALQPMLPDPAIEEWINFMAENDPEKKIAGYAAGVLGAPDEAGSSKK